MPNRNPPAFCESAGWDALLFVPPSVAKNRMLRDELKLKGEPGHFLRVVPLTTAECDYKLEKGLDAILDRFDENRHSHVYDPTRKGYV
jgi:Suppressor of fused protein (SUFU)